MKQRLDQRTSQLKLVSTRSQAESYIKLGKVTVDGRVVTKPGLLVSDTAEIKLAAGEQYVSRAGLKLASVAAALGLDFTDNVVLDVGSSTGGFTDYALRHGARRVIAVEVGTDQLHPSLRNDPRIELHEKTDIRDVEMTRNERPRTGGRNSQNASPVMLSVTPDVVVADVSFISLREILPHILKLCSSKTDIVVMLKPQFEAMHSSVKHKGVIKNDSMRRDILRDFERWCSSYFVIIDKADSEVAGAKGNRERFYLLHKAAK